MHFNCSTSTGCDNRRDLVEFQRVQSFSGTVIYGQQLGRQIGFPTANLKVDLLDITLKHGVYGVKVYLGKCQHLGIMNIGTRPTVTNSLSDVNYEVHILDFNENIYNNVNQFHN